MRSRLLYATVATVAAGALAVAGIAATGASASSPTTAPDDGDDRRSAVADARAVLTDHARQLGLGRGQDAVVRGVSVADELRHVHFDRTYRGLPVIGGDFIVHTDASGDLDSVTGDRVRLKGLSATPEVRAPWAADRAAGRVAYEPRASKPELVVYAVQGKPRLAWRTDVRGRGATGEPKGMYVVTDARTGKLIVKYPSIQTEEGSGTGLHVGEVPVDTTPQDGQYAMIDPDRGDNTTYNAGELFTDDDNAWGDGTNDNAQSAGVDAHFAIATTWDYFLDVHGRNGIRDDGVGAESYVHDGDYVNASWSDACFCMRYGDGDGTTYEPLTSLDVGGHEMSHGVTSNTAGLEYVNESGGLNEATSDIFGTMVEFYADNPEDVPDYVIGEKIFVDEDPADNYIRRMDQPSVDGASYDCWEAGIGDEDVHYSSGPANHFFYLLAEGSGAKDINGVPHDSPTCDGSTVTGIGNQPAAAIWYKALTEYMTSTTDYHEAREATLSAASDLYGAESAEYAATDAAWAAVNVTGDGSDPDPRPSVDLAGTVALDNCSGSLVRYTTSEADDPALVLTAGHCHEGGFMDPGEVLVDEPSSRSMTLLDADGNGAGELRATSVAYGTMTDTDALLYELDQTYAEIEAATDVPALTLATHRPGAGEDITVASGYWKETYTCAVDAYVYRLHEADWTWKQSMRYLQPGCEIIGGTSGSPVVRHDTGRVAAINNTTNENGEECTLNNPCEEDQDGNVTFEQGHSYAQQSKWFYTCLTDTRQLDLTLDGCRLPAPA